MPLLGRFPAKNAAILIVDIQTRLLERIPQAPLIIANAKRLILGARCLEIPIHATEQYPKGLGSTVEPLLELLPDRIAKTEFSAVGASGIAPPITHVTLVGIEAHVCILHTALELLQRGFGVQVVSDAVGSRSESDREIALRRLEHAGAILTTSETVLFEWIGYADHPRFKTISSLVRDFIPPPSN